jgi:hypothetical protein
LIKVTIKTTCSGADKSPKREARVYKFDVNRKSEPKGFLDYQPTQTLQIKGAGQHDFRNGITVYDEGDEYNKDYKYIDDLDIELDAKDVLKIAKKALET